MKNVNTFDEIIRRVKVLVMYYYVFILAETSRDSIFQLEQQLRHWSGMKIGITKASKEGKQMVWL